MFSPMDCHVIALGWHLSPHARDRIRTRGVRASRLVEALKAPDVCYPSGGDQVRTSGRLAVVVDPSSRTVLTVLLTGDSAWDEANARTLLRAGV